MARKFLYFVAAIVVLILLGLLALRIWADEITQLTFVPSAEFTRQPALESNVYAKPDMWIARPGMGETDPALWLPEGAEEPGEKLNAAVFFVHPTSYLQKESWNAPLDHAESRNRALTYVKGMASAFNVAAELWAPRYRQATFGAFLTEEPEGKMAVDAAYDDVLRAFDYFLEGIDEGQPIVLAGHSQGSLHLMRLLKDRVAGKPLAGRIAAAYVVGWPISLEHDLPEMGLPACATPAQSGCVMSWSTFAEPAEPPEAKSGYPAGLALDGGNRFDAAPLCTNPLTGGVGGSAPADANLGTLVPSGDLLAGSLQPDLVPARCDERGLLLIGEPPEMGPYVLPGNNYHVYDIPLFWANLRADVTRRIEAWKP